MLDSMISLTLKKLKLVEKFADLKINLLESEDFVSGEKTQKEK